MGGLQDFVKFLNEGKETLNKPIYFEAENEDGMVEVAMQWSSSYFFQLACSSLSRITSTRIDGGTHLDGFKQGVTRTINDYARSKGILKEKGLQPLGRRHRERVLAADCLREAARPAVRGSDARASWATPEIRALRAELP